MLCIALELMHQATLDPRLSLYWTQPKTAAINRVSVSVTSLLIEVETGLLRRIPRRIPNPDSPSVSVIDGTLGKKSLCLSASAREKLV